MNTTKNKTKKWKVVLGVLGAIILIIGIVIWCIFGNLVRTLFGIERVDQTQMFTMEYHGDYGIDKLMEQGVSSDAELVKFIVNELTHGIPLNFDLPDLGCSTFFAENENGEDLFGRNFDMYYSPMMVVKTSPKNGYKSISMANLAYIGYNEDKLPEGLSESILALAAPYVPMDGMNEKGLAISVMLIDTEPTYQDTEKPDITTTAAIRMVLDKAADVEEAVALLEKYDMHSSANSCYHFMIADASGSNVVVEYVGDEMVVLPDEKVSTNFLLSPGDFDFGKGQDRYDIIVSELENCDGVLSAQEAMTVLEKCSQKESKEKKSSTQWSCVYNLDTLTVDVAAGMDWEHVYKYSLDK